MADIKIVGMVIHTDEPGEENTEATANAELLLIGDNGKMYGIETRFFAEGEWRVAPMDILEFDETMEAESTETAEAGAEGEETIPADQVPADEVDDEAGQPPASSFGGSAEVA